MSRWKSSLRAVVLACVAVGVVALAQTAAEKPSVDVLRVGARLACQCGCTDTIATCSMLECSFCKPAKLKIAKMQSAGISDKQIIDDFMRDNGPAIFRSEPNAFGWIVPYALLGVGLLAIWWFMRRYYKPKALLTEPGPVAIDDPALERYRVQIEKDTKNLD